MKVLVTGANGLVGRATCMALYRSGFVVRAASRVMLPSMPEIESFSISSIHAQTHWESALALVDAVVHCAARVHVMHDADADPLSAFRAVNCHGTLNLARQAAAAGVKRFIFISSVKVNGEFTVPGQAFTEEDTPNPQDAYSQSKLEAEQGLREIAAETGMKLVVVRSPLVYGPGVKANFAALMRAVQRGWPLPLGAIHNQRSLVALDNLADFIVTCITHAGAVDQTFLISDGQDLSTTELVRALAHVAGVSSHLLPVPMRGLAWAGRLLGKEDAVQRLIGNLQIDSSKARNLLGWVPKVSVQEGLRRAMLGNGSR